MFTDLEEIIVKVIDPNYGGHKAIVLTTENSCYHRSPQVIKRKYSAQNKKNFLELLDQQEWQSMIEEGDANKAMDRFMYAVHRSHENAFPICIIIKSEENR